MIEAQNILIISCSCIMWEKLIFPMLCILSDVVKRLAFKPINCAPCLSFWLGIGWFGFHNNMGLAAVTYIITVLLSKEYDRATI